MIAFPLELETRLYYSLRLILHLYRWAVARHLNEFCSKRQFMNFEIYNFSHFQNVISNDSPTRRRHYDALRTKIDMWLTPKKLSVNISATTNFEHFLNQRRKRDLIAPICAISYFNKYFHFFQQCFILILKKEGVRPFCLKVGDFVLLYNEREVYTSYSSVNTVTYYYKRKLEFWVKLFPCPKITFSIAFSLQHLCSLQEQSPRRVL